MEILLKRIARKQQYTIGRMYIDGEYFCDTCEDRDRLYFREKKVMHKTAIPCGKYEVTQDVTSPKYGDREPYKTVCDGRVPRLLDVPQFEGVLIHIGNKAEDSSGCILVGKNRLKGMVLNSTSTWTSLMNEHLLPARERKEKVYLTIV